MNVDTGHLVRLSELFKEELKEKEGKEEKVMSYEQYKEERMKELTKTKGYEPVPKRMQEQAETALEGKKESYINLNGDSDLAKWAGMKREQKKRKHKRKITKASKRANRS